MEHATLVPARSHFQTAVLSHLGLLLRRHAVLGFELLAERVAVHAMVPCLDEREAPDRVRSWSSAAIAATTVRGCPAEATPSGSFLFSPRRRGHTPLPVASPHVSDDLSGC